MKQEPSSLFPRTRWTLVARLRGAEQPEAVQAWNELCQAYRSPVLNYLRRHHPSQHEAEDLAQDFFCRLMHRDLLRDVAAGQGRLRAWLLLLLKRFMLNAQAHARAQKRGGGMEKVSLDALTEFPLASASPPDADLAFDRHWAFTLIERAFQRLHEEHCRPAQRRTFEALRPFLLHLPPHTHSQLADSLGMSEGAIKVALHRLRQRFGGVLRDEVASTVSCDRDVDDEMRHLLCVISAE
jgi:RNA polymerase sigma factor (sigma-70 family)